MSLATKAALERSAGPPPAPVTARPGLPRAYAAVGAVLGLGAPLGLLALDRLLARPRGEKPDSRALTYVTLTTPLFFGLFGSALGSREQRLRSAAMQLHRLRDEFAAVVAHDLRNPLQAILLELELLMGSVQDGEVRVPLATIARLRRNCERLAQMVSDLLDATRIEASRLRVLPQPLSAAEAVQALIDRIRPTLGKHPIEVEIAGHPPPIMADPQRLDQILTNLIENAAKYSAAESPISVHIREQGGGVVIAVHDRGVGIAPDELPRLFDRFYQSKRARAMKTGLGLGLYITSGLVAAHGGRIDVRSEPGQGSVFSVWLPAALAPG